MTVRIDWKTHMKLCQYKFCSWCIFANLVDIPPGFWGQRAPTKEPQPVYGKLCIFYDSKRKTKTFF